VIQSEFIAKAILNFEYPSVFQIPSLNRKSPLDPLLTPTCCCCTSCPVCGFHGRGAWQNHHDNAAPTKVDAMIRLTLNG
jgi:hypothetical protein